MREIFFLGILLFVLGCKSKGKKEALSLTAEKFSEILSDVHEFEGGFDFSLYRDSTVAQQQIESLDSVFLKHQVTKSEFVEEYNRYVNYHSTDLDSIYERLIDEFQLKQDSIEQAKKLPKRGLKKSDSLHNAQKLTERPMKEIKPLQRKMPNQ